MPDTEDAGNPSAGLRASGSPATRGAIREHLAEIAERYAAAERREWQARVQGDAGDLAAAELERQEAQGDYHAASLELADLLLLLLRHAIRQRPDALRDLLLRVLTDPVTDIALAVQQEARR
jgi:hypothetical protein